MTNIEEKLAKRLGNASDAQDLAKAYIEGVDDWAREWTSGEGPVPTTLIGERVQLLLHVSKQARRLLTDREIAALWRLTPGTARRIAAELRAMHEDTIQPFIYDYAFSGAKKAGFGEYEGTKGTIISFDSQSKLDAFVTEASRTSVDHAVKKGDAEHPHKAYVGEGIDLDRYL